MSSLYARALQSAILKSRYQQISKPDAITSFRNAAGQIIRKARGPTQQQRKYQQQGRKVAEKLNAGPGFFEKVKGFMGYGGAKQRRSNRKVRSKSRK
jgi:hypothetical protein